MASHCLPACLALACCCILGAAAAPPAPPLCAGSPNVHLNLCGPPANLTNYQGYLPCDVRVRLAQPRSTAELAALVAGADSVRAVGAGHSWHGALLCPPPGERSLAVYLAAMDRLQPLREAIKPGQALPRRPLSDLPGPGWPIQVDPAALTVTVDAGVSQRELLQFLASLGEEPGYTLGAASMLLDQTMGGAVATGTHGSSTTFGSLSRQVVAMEVVLADGSVRILSAAADPHLFRALRLSAGRLGVITRLTFPIRRQPVMDRTVRFSDTPSMAAHFHGMQAAYGRLAAKAARSAAGAAALEDWLASLNEAAAFYNPMTGTTITVDYQESAKAPAPAAADASAAGRTASDGNAAAQAALDAMPLAGLSAQGTVAINTAFLGNAAETAAGIDAFMASVWTNASGLALFDMHPLVQAWLDFERLGAMDMWEAAVPLELLGDCFDKLVSDLAAPGPPAIADVILFRLLGKEDAYLGYGVDGPVMMFNFNDLNISESAPGQPPNRKLIRAMERLRDECRAKFHFGKTGWATVNSCYDGATAYPSTWCHFGCAVQEMDPAGKFAGQSALWRWRAQRGGRSMPLTDCCGPAGFDYGSCRCLPRDDCQAWRLPQGSGTDSDMHAEL